MQRGSGGFIVRSEVRFGGRRDNHGEINGRAIFEVEVEHLLVQNHLVSHYPAEWQGTNPIERELGKKNHSIIEIICQIEISDKGWVSRWGSGGPRGITDFEGSRRSGRTIARSQQAWKRKRKKNGRSAEDAAWINQPCRWAFGLFSGFVKRRLPGKVCKTGQQRIEAVKNTTQSVEAIGRTLLPAGGR
jgi:hypothetical protein